MLKNIAFIGIIIVLGLLIFAGVGIGNDVDDVNTGDDVKDQMEQDLVQDEETTPPEEVVVIPRGEEQFMILINKQNSVTEDFKPADLELTAYRATDRAESNQYMVSAAAIAFNTLSEAAKEAGYEIVVTTAYRSYGFQKILYDNYVAKDGQEAADTYSARPGTSEHQSGLAADVSSPSVGYKLTQDYANAPEGQWLAENCHLYGFIIRFPEGKTDITGYIYEPWHIRYVGVEVATYIMENNLTFEEYIQLCEENPQE